MKDTDDDLNIDPEHLVGRLGYWLLRAIIIFTIVMVIVILRYKIKQKTKEEVNTECFWNNYEPSKKSYISGYDYINGIMEYSPMAYPGQFDKPKTDKKISGVTINTRDTKIETGLSNEEILEQLEIDYNDIYDYFGIELR